MKNLYIIILVMISIAIPNVSKAFDIDTQAIDRIIDQIAGVGDAMFGEVTADSADKDAYVKEMMDIGSDTYNAFSGEVDQGMQFNNACLQAIQQYQVSQNTYKQCLEAAKKGDKIAQFYVGAYLYKTDPEKSKYWLSKAAAGGVPAGHDLLGNMYAIGKGTKQDFGKAFYHYMQASDKLPQTRRKLKVLYLEQHKKYRQDNKKLLAFIHQIADAGYVEAQYELGIIYQTGKSPLITNSKGIVEINKIQAYKWLFLSAHNVLTTAEHKQAFNKIQKEVTSEQRTKAESEIRQYQRKQQSKR